MVDIYSSIATLNLRPDSYLSAQRDLIYDVADSFMWLNERVGNWVL